MKIKKRVIQNIFVINLILLSCSIYMEFYLTKKSIHYGYISNLVNSLFASGVLILIVYSIEYSIEKRRALESFYLKSHLVINQFVRIDFFGDFDNITQNYVNEKFLKCLNTYTEISKYDLNSFDDSFANIDFLLGNFWLRKRIYSQIYRPIRDLYRLICEVSWHFEMQLSGETNNVSVMCMKLSEIQKRLFISQITVGSEFYVQNIYRNHIHKLKQQLEFIRAKTYRIKKKLIQEYPINTKYMQIKNM
ncbi:hypothetical protein [Fusibacter bizertensis]